jgi:hypothetical protein
MIDWDRPYGEHFGGKGAAKYTQDGTDFDAHGRELAQDGTGVEVFDQTERGVVAESANMATTQVVHGSAVVDVSTEVKAVNPAPADYTALKSDIGEEAYAELSREEKRMMALTKRAERLA